MWDILRWMHDQCHREKPRHGCLCLSTYIHTYTQKSKALPICKTFCVGSMIVATQKTNVFVHYMYVLSANKTNMWDILRWVHDSCHTGNQGTDAYASAHTYIHTYTQKAKALPIKTFCVKYVIGATKKTSAFVHYMYVLSANKTNLWGILRWMHGQCHGDNPRHGCLCLGTYIHTYIHIEKQGVAHM